MQTLTLNDVSSTLHSFLITVQKIQGSQTLPVTAAYFECGSSLLKNITLHTFPSREYMWGSLEMLRVLHDRAIVESVDHLKQIERLSLYVPQFVECREHYFDIMHRHCWDIVKKRGW